MGFVNMWIRCKFNDPEITTHWHLITDHNMKRRNFIKSTGIISGGMSLVGIPLTSVSPIKKRKIMKIASTESNFEREPLIRPFGFKGGYMTEIWQTVARMVNDTGISKTGLCTQNVLWSDANVFEAHSEAGGNALMYTLTERALQIARGQSFTNPIELLDNILEEVYQYGKAVTGNMDLRMTFALNALVGVDNAAWLLYAEENGIDSFDDLIPSAYRDCLSNHHDKVAAIPLMAYTIPVSEITETVEQGFFFMKIKIGQPGTQAEMLEKDMARLTEIHEAIGHKQTPHTSNGKLPYYFDANGRYEKKETLLRLIDHARKIGAFDQIALIEEPFPEKADIDVTGIPVRLASDESAHTDQDALIRIQMGYKAIALKAIAKTLSMTMKIAKVAHENNVPCFCADLTVNPILVDWNKNIASRLDAFPGIGGLGLCETNGHQNYSNWKRMESYHPYTYASWRIPVDGVFFLNGDFYRKSGGILTPSHHYEEMFQH
jgi:L-alanine-DL-glutamate epimerase-like enolase superfamily enzyme